MHRDELISLARQYTSPWPPERLDPPEPQEGREVSPQELDDKIIEELQSCPLGTEELFSIDSWREPRELERSLLDAKLRKAIVSAMSETSNRTLEELGRIVLQRVYASDFGQDIRQQLEAQ